MKRILQQSRQRVARPCCATPGSSVAAVRKPFSTSPRRRQRDDDDQRPVQSPFKTFVDTLKDEIRKNRELQENLQQLEGQAGAVADSEAMRKAKELYEKARLTASLENNPKLKAAAEAMKRNGQSVSDAVAEAVRTVEDSSFMRGSKAAIRKGSEAVYNATEPVRNTETYKVVSASVTDALDDVGNNTRYGGFVEKEARRRRRERLLALGKGRSGLAKARVKANEEAGEAVVLHPESATLDAVPASRLPKPLASALANFSEAYQSSENPVVSSMRSVTNAVGRVFEETETAKVIKSFKALDPDFQQESFLKELREYIVPEVVDAYTTADTKTLKLWCSEAAFNVLTAQIQPLLQQGCISDGRVLDIRAVDIQGVKQLENDVNVIIVSFRTQELTVWRDAKGAVIAGDEDRADLCTYVTVMTRVAEELDVEETGGWKIIDIGRRAQKVYL